LQLATAAVHDVLSNNRGDLKQKSRCGGSGGDRFLRTWPFSRRQSDVTRQFEPLGSAKNAPHQTNSKAYCGLLSYGEKIPAAAPFLEDLAIQMKKGRPLPSSSGLLETPRTSRTE
jgi:hypothetical protein